MPAAPDLASIIGLEREVEYAISGASDMRGLAPSWKLTVGFMDILVGAGANLGCWADLMEPLKDVAGARALLVIALALTKSWLLSNF